LSQQASAKQAQRSISLCHLTDDTYTGSSGMKNNYLFPLHLPAGKGRVEMEEKKCCYEKLIFRITKEHCKSSHIFVFNDSVRPGRSDDRIPVGRRDFPYTTTRATGLTQPRVQWVPGPFPGVKRLGCGVDHPAPPSKKKVKVKHTHFRPCRPRGV
jgi:hypothetical protein